MLIRVIQTRIKDAFFFFHEISLLVVTADCVEILASLSDDPSH